MQALSPAKTRTLEFGIYRDGDNNLDESQGVTLGQALKTSAADSRIEYTVQDTTSLGGKKLRTDSFTLADGHIGQASIDAPHDMASEQNLAQFVARTLDNAQKAGAKETWIDLVDHGAGDGGGLEADSAKQIMAMPQMAQAIADGIKLHAREHPEDAGRKIDGVVANQCLMASLGFADALSHVGVTYLAASPETMVSPGVPSNVAHAIAAHESDPREMADAVVNDVMQYRYNVGPGFDYTPAAAFDVLDVSRQSFSGVESSVKRLNDALAAATGSQRDAIRQDASAIEGMARIPDARPDMPWHADRPALALYDSLASDDRLDASIRSAARDAEKAVGGIVLAHRESNSFVPFDGSNYSDAAGPTVHFPVTRKQIDPWAPRISETHNRFFAETDAGALERVIA